MAIVRIHNKRNQSIPIELIDSTSKTAHSVMLGAKKFMDVKSEELTKDCYSKAGKRILKLEVREDKVKRGIPLDSVLAMSTVE